MNARRGYELEGLFFGRPIRPFHLAITIATAVVGGSNLTRESVTLLGHVPSNLIGAAAVMSAVLLTFGWWRTNESAAEWGLLIAVGVWIARGVYIATTEDGLFIVGSSAAVALSVAWAIGACGAYLLERYDHETRSDE